MNGLVFLQTWSVDDFKKETGTVTLEVKRNPHTGKLFFAYGNEVGAVSDRFESGGFSSPVVSQVCSEDTGDTFFLLHQRGEGGVSHPCKVLTGTTCQSRAEARLFCLASVPKTNK